MSQGLYKTGAKYMIKEWIDIDVLVVLCKTILLIELAIYSSVPLNCRVIILLFKLILS